MRADGGEGILFDSLRHTGGVNAVAYRPSKVLNVVQTDHYSLRIDRNSSRIEARRITA